jgi:hypothetical protein
MTGLRRFTDGVLFQAVLTGSLSFSHIHDLAAAHGQTGWKAWLYPLSVDLLTVAAYRKLTAARHGHTPKALAWCAFLLGLAASLAANIAGAWQNPDRQIAVALGVWPAVAFLVCTLLAHDAAPQAAPALDSALSPQSTVPVVASVPAVSSAAPVPASVPQASVAPALLSAARRIAEEHQRRHGTPIDLAALRERLRIPEPLAATIHAQLTATAGA